MSFLFEGRSLAPGACCFRAVLGPRKRLNAWKQDHRAAKIAIRRFVQGQQIVRQRPSRRGAQSVAHVNDTYIPGVNRENRTDHAR